LSSPWTGGYWKVYRGNEDTGLLGGLHLTEKVELQEGSYTIKPWQDNSFIPFEITITKCQTMTVEMGGFFEFTWTGGYWKVYRGNEDTGLWGGLHLTDKVGLQEGSYTIKPWQDNSFIPFNITVTKGQTITVEMGGFFEFKWTGYWKVYRGNEDTGLLGGREGRIARRVLHG